MSQPNTFLPPGRARPAPRAAHRQDRRAARRGPRGLKDTRVARWIHSARVFIAPRRRTDPWGPAGRYGDHAAALLGLRGGLRARTRAGHGPGLRQARRTRGAAGPRPAPGRGAAAAPPGARADGREGVPRRREHPRRRARARPGQRGNKDAARRGRAEGRDPRPAAPGRGRARGRRQRAVRSTPARPEYCRGLFPV